MNRVLVKAGAGVGMLLYAAMRIRVTFLEWRIATLRLEQVRVMLDSAKIRREASREIGETTRLAQAAFEEYRP